MKNEMDNDFIILKRNNHSTIRGEWFPPDYIKMEARRNPDYEKWRTKLLPKYFDDLDKWESKGRVNNLGNSEKAPIYPEKPKMFKAKVQLLSKKKADELIKELELESKYWRGVEDFGAIYDTKNADFRTKYYGEIDYSILDTI